VEKNLATLAPETSERYELLTFFALSCFAFDSLEEREGVGGQNFLASLNCQIEQKKEFTSIKVSNDIYFDPTKDSTVYLSK
jgi:hypothetical protein